MRCHSPGQVWLEACSWSGLNWIKQMSMDRLTEAALDALEQRAWWIAFYSAELEHSIRMLNTVPGWQTKARTMLEKAELDLSRALEQVRAAKAGYEQLPKSEAAE